MHKRAANATLPMSENISLESMMWLGGTDIML